MTSPGFEKISAKYLRWLFDDFIRLYQDLRRNRKPYLLRRLKIYHQLELRWLLYGKAARLRALEDLVYVSGCSTTSFIRWGTSGKFTT